MYTSEATLKSSDRSCVNHWVSSAINTSAISKMHLHCRSICKQELLDCGRVGCICARTIQRQAGSQTNLRSNSYITCCGETDTCIPIIAWCPLMLPVSRYCTCTGSIMSLNWQPQLYEHFFY